MIKIISDQPFTRVYIIIVNFSIENKFSRNFPYDPDSSPVRNNRDRVSFRRKRRETLARIGSELLDTCTRLSLSNIRTRYARLSYTHIPRIIGVTTISVIIDEARASIQRLVYTVNDREFHRINFQFSPRVDLFASRLKREREREKGKEIGGKKENNN